VNGGVCQNDVAQPSGRALRLESCCTLSEEGLLLGDELLRRLAGRGQLGGLLLAVLLDYQHGFTAGQKVAHLLLLLVVLENVFDLGLEGRKAQGLHCRRVSCADGQLPCETLASRAERMWSGAIVFFDSFSQMSFASDEIRWMNSAARSTWLAQGGKEAKSPTQHSMTISRVSFEHVMSFGSSSVE
jgi:hypothetical protein